jgi:hypothetical protein
MSGHAETILMAIEGCPGSRPMSTRATVWREFGSAPGWSLGSTCGIDKSASPGVDLASASVASAFRRSSS